MDSTPTAHDRFLSLVESHRRLLLKVGWAYSHTPHDRDDLLQEIVARLWSAFVSFDERRPFSTWMYRVALNVAIDCNRRRRRWRRETSGHDDLEAALGGVDDTFRQDQWRELHELLESHSAADRALLLLYLEGQSHREIGEVLGISESNVGTRLNRLKNALRQSVQDSTAS